MSNHSSLPRICPTLGKSLSVFWVTREHQSFLSRLAGENRESCLVLISVINSSATHLLPLCFHPGSEDTCFLSDGRHVPFSTFPFLPLAGSSSLPRPFALPSGTVGLSPTFPTFIPAIFLFSHDPHAQRSSRAHMAFTLICPLFLKGNHITSTPRPSSPNASHLLP